MGWKEIRRLSGAVLAAAVLTACTGGASSTSTSRPFEPSPGHLQNREMRTKLYEGISEANILSACAGVLQDMGFSIEESETKLGVVTGEKISDASSKNEDLITIIVSLLTLSDDEPEPDYQKYWISVAVRPASAGNAENHHVSVTFQRIVWNTDDEIMKRETLVVPEIYQDFFNRLSKSVFLEAQGI